MPPSMQSCKRLRPARLGTERYSSLKWTKPSASAIRNEAWLPCKYRRRLSRARETTRAADVSGHGCNAWSSRIRESAGIDDHHAGIRCDPAHKWGHNLGGVVDKSRDYRELLSQSLLNLPFIG